jgi:hypothetical protein
MSEVEFDRLLNAVREAVAPVPPQDAWDQPLTADRLPTAANDNGGAWPFLSFPDGWGAAC